MKKRLVKLALVGTLVGAALYLALGAGLNGGFGFALPDGSKYIVQFNVGVNHVPAPQPEQDDAIRIHPEETT